MELQDIQQEDLEEEVWANIKFMNQDKEYPGQKGNFIRTTRYTLLTFLPLALFENFRVFTNIYFTIVLIICCLPLSPVHWIFTFNPFMIVLVISMSRAGIEDLMKYKEDKRRNTGPVKIYKYGEWYDAMSKDIQVGDIIMVNSDEMVPCDILYLTSSKENQKANYTVAELNGEAAVQTISPHPAFKGAVLPQMLTKEEFTVQVPKPDRDLYKFDAKLISGDKSWPISIQHMLFRGSVIQYTDWVMGVAIRTGHDCKIMMNQRHPPAKRTKFDRDINRMVFIIFCFKMTFVFVVSGLCCHFEQHNNFSILDGAMPKSGVSFMEAFLQWFVLFSYIIPLSLMSTIEISRLFLLFTMSYDRNMVEEDRGKATPHNSSMIGQLGLVTHVLSDKTGTLTENVMHLVKFTDSNGTFETKNFFEVGEKEPNYITRSMEFIRALVLCNTVIVYDNHGTIEYNAESPDEAAFVRFAEKAGVKLLQRESNFMIVEMFGEVHKYNILSVIPFNSDRKRMSIVIQREGEDNAIVFTKGADDIMYQLSNEVKYNTELGVYASEGLRTLVFAQRALTKAELDSWLEAYEEANMALKDRDKKLDQISSMIESKLDVIGVSAVEDKLQPSVPEAILWLRLAGIKMWVLTGDKLETAIEIGKTSSVIMPNADVLILSNPHKEQTIKQAEDYVKHLNDFTEPVLVLTEHPTEYLLESNDENIIKLLKNCKSVIFSRATPFIKAKVVDLVNTFDGALTLAIGDGANDVGMIQQSHVGVGITGLEGSQAAMCSDFAIPRFRHLIRLIAVHGHWADDRFAICAIMLIYKNIVFAFVMFFMSFDTLFSPSSYFDGFFMSCFNLVFTIFPPYVYAWLEQDIIEPQLIKYPQLHRSSFNPMAPKYIAYYSLLGIFQAAVIYYVNKFGMPEAGFTENGYFTYLGVILVVSLQSCFWTRYWNWLTFAVNVGSIVVALLTMYIYGGYSEPEIMGAVLYDMKNPAILSMVMAMCIISLVPSLAFEYIFEVYHPDLNRLLREREKLDKDLPIDFAESMKMVSSETSEEKFN